MDVSVLQINHLTVHRSARVDRTRGVEVLAGIELSLRAGEVTALFGETGCGKTTLINSILGWLPDPLWVTDGRILLSDDRNVDLLQLDQKSRRNYLGLKIGYVPQDVRSGLNPLMNARQTVEEAARRKGQGYRERTDEAFRRAGLEDAFLRDHANRRPGRLSGGQCQRVLIAQAIVNQPTVLLLDEPTASLDPTARIEVLSTLRNLANEGCAICLVSHDFSAVAGIADVVAIMYLGRLVEVGKTDDVLANPMHPYTRALLACVPRLDHHQPLQTIPDGIDATTGTVNGCRFHPRCPLRISRCATEDPLLQELETGRQVACHVVNQINES